MAEKAIQGFRVARCSRRRPEGTLRPGTGERTGAALRRSGDQHALRAVAQRLRGKQVEPLKRRSTAIFYMQTPGRGRRCRWIAAVRRPCRADRDRHEHRQPRVDDPDRRRRSHSTTETQSQPAAGWRDITLAGPLLAKTLLIHALTTGGSNAARARRVRQGDRERTASIDLPGSAIGTPMTYSIGGKQYVRSPSTADSAESRADCARFLRRSPRSALSGITGCGLAAGDNADALPPPSSRTRETASVCRLRALRCDADSDFRMDSANGNQIA